ncbi:response regulator [Adhaeribacter aerolatus]|uniref:Response regulator n=1 Tax=Adhaeribacter aerolatus TaxID=670289 RepID=A0A512B4K2_9BACT|nr:response regulator [Adhaeribacter aerolatus]GEO06697.1 response regulator [Adhaeribacter aerolatus]
MKKLRSILLVDDNDTSNFLNERLLKRMAVTDEIKVLSNGKSAFEFLEKLNRAGRSSIETKPELILLDINMPVVDGFEFLELYNQLDEQFRSDILVAILSTSNHPQDTSRASDFNAYYIIKPLTIEKVEALLSMHYAGAE